MGVRIFETPILFNNFKLVLANKKNDSKVILIIKKTKTVEKL